MVDARESAKNWARRGEGWIAGMSGVKGAANVLVGMRASNDNQGDQGKDDEQEALAEASDELLTETKEKLVENGFPAWAPDLQMARRGARQISYFKHPRLPDPNKWYDRYGGRTGILAAIQEADGAGKQNPNKTTAAAGLPKAPSPLRDGGLLMTESQVNEAVNGVTRLLRHFQTVQERMKRLAADLAHNEEAIAAMERHMQSLKRRRI
jgi:hypothetical protein